MTKREKRAAKARTGRRGSNGGSARELADRRRKPVVLVVTEGEKTEPSYLAWLNRRIDGVNIQAVHDKPNPEDVVNRALEARETGPSSARRNDDGDTYDDVWCFIDIDTHPGLENALQTAARAGLSVAVSGLCFETWLLMHLTDQTSPYDKPAAEKKAWIAATGGERRNDDDRLDDIASGLEAALQRAATQRKRHESLRTPVRQRNPSTDVDKFVQKIATMAQVAPSDLYGLPSH